MKNIKQTSEEIRITHENFFDYTVTDSEKLVRISTGEIIDSYAMIVQYHYIFEDIKESLSTDKKQEVKKIYKNNWRKNNRFTKLYQVNSKELLKLSNNAKSTLFSLLCLVGKSTNEVIYKNNKAPTNKDLEKLTGYKIRTLNRILSELEDNNIICRKGNTHQRRIFINPKYFFNGQNLLRSTYDMFEP